MFFKASVGRQQLTARQDKGLLKLNSINCLPSASSMGQQFRLPLANGSGGSALPDIGSSFAAIPELLSQQITDLGVNKLLSSLFGKNADGHIAQSQGKFGAMLKFGNIDEKHNDTNSVYLNIELYGRNAFIILPMLPLTKSKFRFISANDTELGTYLITLNSDWYKCYTKH